MGLKGLSKEALTEASGEDNRKNKTKTWEIFSLLVMDGDAYMLIYCHMQDSHNAVVVEVNVHSNYIVDYKPGEVVIVPVNAQFTEWDGAEVFNKKSGSEVTSSWTGCCSTSEEGIRYRLEPITYNPSTKTSVKYSVTITQSTAKVVEFRKFFKVSL